MEPNVFFTGRFLAPAMPRLEDRQVRLALIRDQNGTRSRMRLLMPFSVDKPGFAVGPSIIRVWANTFGAARHAAGRRRRCGRDARQSLRRRWPARTLQLPTTLVLPDIRLNGRFVAAGQGRRHRPQPAGHRRQSLSAADAAERRGRASTIWQRAITALTSARDAPPVAAAGGAGRASSTTSPANRAISTVAHGRIPGAGGRRLEGQEAQRHGARSPPRRLCPRGDLQPRRASTPSVSTRSISTARRSPR